ncbi:hypothetical protein [Saccharopolyspora taberi]|uniref:Uncharacterized protein n=1 Tax=Saccharopolyspora taberi TaxID=60895 RepID=A0ABN3V5W6_9PSEU
MLKVDVVVGVGLLVVGGFVVEVGGSSVVVGVWVGTSVGDGTVGVGSGVRVGVPVSEEVVSSLLLVEVFDVVELVDGGGGGSIGGGVVHVGVGTREVGVRLESGVASRFSWLP